MVVCSTFLNLTANFPADWFFKILDFLINGPGK